MVPIFVLREEEVQVKILETILFKVIISIRLFFDEKVRFPYDLYDL